jgi:hypothetical protein
MRAGNVSTSPLEPPKQAEHDLPPRLSPYTQRHFLYATLKLWRRLNRAKAVHDVV